jgi:hypothetical protein
LRVGIGGGRRVLITAAPPSPGCPGSPPHAFFLSPRECLRRLGLGAAGAFEHYAWHPHDYLTDCGEPPAGLAGDLRLALGREGAAALPARWREAIQVLRQPGRVRDLGDLTLVLVPESVNPNLALAAARLGPASLRAVRQPADGSATAASLWLHLFLAVRSA